jgi:hypothetical protein
MKGSIISRSFLFTSYFLLLTSHLFISCAPKVITPVPPQYGEAFSLDEIVSKVGDDIQVLKAIADIRIEKNNELYDQINASVIVKRPDSAHMRMYKFGMLVSDIVMKDGSLHILTGKSDKKTGELINEFFHAVFWWDGLERGAMYREGDAYIIKINNKEIRLDRATLLPLSQEIYLLSKIIHITYTEPHDYDGFWYPSKMGISVDDLRFKVSIDKLIKNPPLGESDFRVPSGG